MTRHLISVNPTLIIENFETLKSFQLPPSENVKKTEK